MNTFHPTIKQLCYLASILLFFACKKEIIVPEVVTPKGTFMMHLHTYIENNEVDAYNINYTTTKDRKLSFSMAQLYLSNIQLVKLDGTMVDLSGKKILKILEKETYIVGDAPVGNYKSIRFKVGLDAITNKLSPTVPSDSAILNKNSMWFGNSAQPDGYVFLHLQGKIDTTAKATGSFAQMQPFVYKIGTDTNYKQVNMPDKNFSIAEGQSEFGHIYIDYNRLFDGIQLNKRENLSITTAAANTTAVATRIVKNIPLMFNYE